MFVLAQLFKGKTSDPKKNHLRFIYMSSAFGGILFGGGFSYYMSQILTKERLSTWDPNWDKKQYLTEEEEIHEKRGVRYLYMVRHGQYNLQEDLDENRTLTLIGKQQAKVTGEKLAHIKFDKIWVSNLKRAQETCSFITKHQKVQPETDSNLAEVFPGRASPDFGKLQQYNENQEWLNEDQQKNVEQAFKTYFKRSEVPHDTQELFVCHANVIRYLLCKTLQIPTEAWIRFSLDHCSITQIMINPDGTLKVQRVGDAGHLTGALNTV